MNELNDKWALVTGASRGIGKEIATALSTLGCNLVLHSRSVEHTKTLAESLSRNGVHTVSLAADLSDPVQVTNLLLEMENAVPRIDILYNNAAIMLPYHEDIWNIPAEEFRQSFETNVISQIRICNALIPSMIERRRGRVINLISGIDEQPQLAPYAITKAAFQKFTHDLAPTLENNGVAINALDPGWLRTDMGSEEAPNAVDSVIPGALVPALLTHSINGMEFKAQDYAGMTLQQAMEAAEQRTSLYQPG